LVSCDSQTTLGEAWSDKLAIGKPAVAGQQAGFALEQMIDLLDHGLEVETSSGVDLWRLHRAAMPPGHGVSRYRWLM